MQWTRACIALGSNLGDRERTIRHALGQLASTSGITLVAASSLYETRPEGGPPNQENYLNAAAVLDVTLSPLELLHAMLDIERALGRERVIPCGPRTIDLDLLFYGDLVQTTPGLILPHPRFCERLFVLEPLAEIAPGVVDPVTGKTIAELLDQLNKQATD